MSVIQDMSDIPRTGVMLVPEPEDKLVLGTEHVLLQGSNGVLIL